jgi:hypothetical protein
MTKTRAVAVFEISATRLTTMIALMEWRKCHEANAEVVHLTPTRCRVIAHVHDVMLIIGEVAANGEAALVSFSTVF